MNLGGAIKLLRIRNNLEQKQLAVLCGISPAYISLIERNERDAVFSIINNIAIALDIPLAFLIFLASSEEDLVYMDPEANKFLDKKCLKYLRPKNI